ncbi:hypothetical protein NUZ5A_20506 [Candidatus Nitrosotenuis uzonensis]|uniref:Uncharacterized protein n=1 Tax=Candidatus Nitrosotenuis uzonensis TaxID=1407055 RepID=A0A812EYM3_9ARCH|nr:hypothetical protein NUZ5A_20506 [Candidatus Nitrosotenuis uzonensis]
MLRLDCFHSVSNDHFPSKWTSSIVPEYVIGIASKESSAMAANNIRAKNNTSSINQVTDLKIKELSGLTGSMSTYNCQFGAFCLKKIPSFLYTRTRTGS